MTVKIGEWTCERVPYYGTIPRCVTATDGDYAVEMDDGVLSVEWDERSDDFRGSVTRSCHVPIEVIRQLLKWHDGEKTDE